MPYACRVYVRVKQTKRHIVSTLDHDVWPMTTAVTDACNFSVCPDLLNPGCTVDWVINLLFIDVFEVFCALGRVVILDFGLAFDVSVGLGLGFAIFEACSANTAVGFGSAYEMKLFALSTFGYWSTP